MDRTSPRTATSEEVTNTAQIAICTASRMSRTVNRRSPPTFAAPVRITCHGSARNTWRTGTIPKSKPLDERKQQRDHVGACIRDSPAR